MKVAWVSRHRPLRAEEDELRRILGPDIELVLVSNTYRNADEVFAELVETNAKVAVVVLPLSVVSRLIGPAQRAGIDLWWPRMQKLHDCEGPSTCPDFDMDTDIWLPYYRSDTGRHMRFLRFERIQEVRLITEPIWGPES